MSAQSDDVVGRVARFRKALEIQNLRVEEAQSSLASAREGLTLAQQEIAILEIEHATLLATLDERARMLYRLGRWGYARMFFSLTRTGFAESPVGGRSTAKSQSPNDPLAGIRLLRALVRQDASTLADLRTNREQAAAVNATLQQRQAEAASWLDRQRRVRRELETKQNAERRALGDLEKREARIASELQGVQSRQERLATLMEIIGKEGGGGLGGLPIEEFRGALDWPVRGKLSRRFGPYRDRQYGTLVPHNGILIAPPLGSTVGSVYPGRVVYSGKFRDVGLVVVLQHTRDALTMYSGLRSANVREGDVVELGGVLGMAAQELYFELRIDKEPMDPEAWLRSL